MKVDNLAGAGPYKLILADPPWKYRRNPLGVTRLDDGSYRNGAPCGSEAYYPVMSEDEICGLPVAGICDEKAALFLWTTCPLLDQALRVMAAWGFHYRGIAYVWAKTTLAGGLYGAKGPEPTFVKPTTELLLVGSTNKTGRPFPILDRKQRQVVLAPRLTHSEKPQVFIERIEQLCGDLPRIELFARRTSPGWDSWGNEL